MPRSSKAAQPARRKRLKTTKSLSSPGPGAKAPVPHAPAIRRPREGGRHSCRNKVESAPNHITLPSIVHFVNSCHAWRCDQQRWGKRRELGGTPKPPGRENPAPLVWAKGSIGGHPQTPAGRPLHPLGTWGKRTDSGTPPSLPAGRTLHPLCGRREVLWDTPTPRQGGLCTP